MDHFSLLYFKSSRLYSRTEVFFFSSFLPFFVHLDSHQRSAVRGRASGEVDWQTVGCSTPTIWGCLSIRSQTRLNYNVLLIPFKGFTLELVKMAFLINLLTGFPRENGRRIKALKFSDCYVAFKNNRMMSSTCCCRSLGFSSSHGIVFSRHGLLPDVSF